MTLLLYLVVAGVTWLTLEFVHNVLGLSPINTAISVVTVYSAITLVVFL